MPALAQTPLNFGWSSVTPHDADYDGDSLADLALYDAGKGTIHVRKINGDNLASDLAVAEAGFSSALADYDGDGMEDLGSYDRENGIWYAFCSHSGYRLFSFPCAVGNSATLPKPADYDGDSLVDLALYDSASGAWIIYPSASGYQPNSIMLGGNGVEAVPADYDGDGKVDPCVYDRETGIWAMLSSSGHYALEWVQYGGPGCEAAPEDFDGDRKADPTVYCAALGVWGTLHSASNYAANLFSQGGPDCVPVPGNYYFTNRADYAVYNTTNGCWTIAYNSPVSALFGNTAKGILTSLVKGDYKKATVDGLGWGMSLIFHRNKHPADPWEAERAMLSEMNGKLDMLLAMAANMRDQLDKLTAQLAYDAEEIKFLVTETLAKQAFIGINTLYDYDDQYKQFYNCDTNHPPSEQAILKFVSDVGGHELEGYIESIHEVILPTDSTTGVLTRWCNMAKLKGITPDNLLDTYTAFFSYFSTLYSYQLKAAAMHVDIRRQSCTNESDHIVTYRTITNTFMAQKFTPEVDEFREQTFDIIMDTIKAAYNPLDPYNPMLVGGVADVLANLEFFSRQWLARDQSLCMTILEADRPSIIANYTNLQAVGPQTLTPQSVTTNRLTSFPYGCIVQHPIQIEVTNGYVFLNVDFGQAPTGTYSIQKADSGFELGKATVRNYDDDMNPTDNQAFTNLFGHLYVSRYSLDQLVIPLDDPAWAANMQEQTSFYNGVRPYEGLWFIWTMPASLSDFCAYIKLEYKQGWVDEAGFGAWPWTYTVGFPFSVKNKMSAPVNARVNIEVKDADTIMQRWDSRAGTYTEQRWCFHDCGGVAGYSLDNCAKWSWQPYTQKYFPAGQTTPWVYSMPTNYYHGKVDAVIAGGTCSSMVFRVGSQIYLQQDCVSGKGSKHESNATGEVRFKVKQIVVSFY